MNALSLFANIGVAEAYLEDIGINVVVANELIERRAKLYSEIYKKTCMICGDITKASIKKDIIATSLKNNVQIVIATPPCQGMSTAGQQIKDDSRNLLVCEVVEVIKKIKPLYVFIENTHLILNMNFYVISI